MCVLCLDWMKQKLSLMEQRKAALELFSTTEDWDEMVHVADVLEEINEKLALANGDEEDRQEILDFGFYLGDE